MLMQKQIPFERSDHSTVIMLGSPNGTSLSAPQTSSPLINRILFVMIICVSVPSVFINLFAIYRLRSNTKLSVFTFRTILHVSLFTTCTCVPLFLSELYFDLYFPFSALTCKIWLVFDYASIVCLGLLVCWASIQRHILIFGPIRLRKLQSTLKFRVIPSLLALGLPVGWYSILASTCTYEQSPPTTFECRPCFENEKIVFLVDTILSLILPLLLTILITFLLVVRIIRLRLKVFRLPAKRWRRCKRLTRQVLLFSSIYLIGLVPYVVSNLNLLYDFWPWMNASWCMQIADAFTYVPCCFSSFISIYAFPEIWARQRSRRHHHKNNRKTKASAVSSSQF